MEKRQWEREVEKNNEDKKDREDRKNIEDRKNRADIEDRANRADRKDSKDKEDSGATERIRLCPDGSYRWIYELSMLRNPILIFSIWRLLGAVCALMLFMYFLLELFDGRALYWLRNYFLTPAVLTLPGIFFVLSLMGYLLLAAMYGGRYFVLFEMNEEKITHTQMSSQFRKAQAICWLSAMAGAAAGQPEIVCSGIRAAVRSSSTSEFRHVKRLVSVRRFHTIKVNQILNRNQIYVREEDFDFVWNYLSEHCKQAKSAAELKSKIPVKCDNKIPV